MKVFTQICRQINLSLLNKIMTIYPKNEAAEKTFQRAFDAYGRKRVRTGTNELSLNGSMHTFDLGHDAYHNDGLDRTKQHIHLRFNRPLNEKLLARTLSYLASYDLISLYEKNCLLVAYHKANPIKIYVKRGTHSHGLFALSSQPVDTTNPPDDPLEKDSIEALLSLKKV